MAEIATDDYENQIAAGVVLPEDIQIDFQSIAGLDRIKQELMEAVILPFSRPDLFPKNSLTGPPKGVLLYGPPGTGKTMLAKAIARETRATFIYVELSSLQSQWFGESQHLMKALFSLARKLEPTIIFIDEIDSFGRTRRDDDHQVVSDMRAEFMSSWDGFDSDGHRVMVLGTTNRLWAIDPAIQRRLPRRFEVPLPNLVHREQILRKILVNEKKSEDLDYLTVAEQTEGYSGSDLKELAKAAANAPVRDFLRAESKQAMPTPRSMEEGSSLDKLRPLTHHDLIKAKEQVQPPVLENPELFSAADESGFVTPPEIDVAGAMAMMHQFSRAMANNSQ